MAPQTKANFAHELQAAITELLPEDEARIKAACGPSWQVIEQALPSSWLDETTFNALNEGLRKEVGDVVFVKLYRQVGRRLTKNPSFQKAVEAFIRLLGVTPHTLLKLSPRVRASLVKDSGTLTYEKVGVREAHMRVEGFPPSTWSLGSTALLLAGCIEGGVAVMGATPEVEIQNLSLSGGGCVYRVRWTT